MGKLKTAVHLLKEDRTIFFGFFVINFFGWLPLPDSIYLKLLYRAYIGRRLNLKNPKTFTEKLQWLKLYDRKPIYTKMVDKYEVKKYVANVIGEEYIIPTIGLYESVDEIPWSSLPNQFVLKTTHGGGGSGVIICKNKEVLNEDEVKKKLTKSLKFDIYSNFKEWPYKNVPRNIIAEKLLEDPENPSDLKDYKFFCFNGEVRFLKVDFNRFINHHANYYDKDWNLLEFGEKTYLPDASVVIAKPETLNQMIILAEKLTDNITFARVDFYSIGKRIYFGEITFYPASGLGKFEPDYWDYKLGDLIKLPVNP